MNGTETAVGKVKTEYTPCAYSSIGKVLRVSMPYAANASPLHWTTYTLTARSPPWLPNLILFSCRNVPPKTRRSAAQIQALLADYHSSGLTRAAFCTARRLPLTILDACRRRATPALLEVDIFPAPSPNESRPPNPHPRPPSPPQGLILFGRSSATRIFLAPDPIDLRKGFDGLVRDSLGEDPLSGTSSSSPIANKPA